MYLHHPLKLPKKAVGDATRAYIRPAHLHRPLLNETNPRTHPMRSREPSPPVRSTSGITVKSPHHRRSFEIKDLYRRARPEGSKKSMRHHNSVLRSVCSASNTICHWTMLVPMFPTTAEARKPISTWWLHPKWCSILSDNWTRM